jgi:nitrate/nitrite transporter NarK
MNMFGNFAGFVAPVGGGLILARTGDWNVLLYLMVAASLAAATCWIFLDPEKRK